VLHTCQKVEDPTERSHALQQTKTHFGNQLSLVPNTRKIPNLGNFLRLPPIRLRFLEVGKTGKIYITPQRKDFSTAKQTSPDFSRMWPSSGEVG
jgi:hypothetical protein